MVLSFPTIDLNPTLGALFVGLLLGAVFYGVTILQTIIYYTTYPKDKIFFKVLVAFLWMLDTLDIAMIAYSLYTYLIVDYLNPLALLHVPWPNLWATIAFIVHEFLVFRIWTLNRNWTLLVIFLGVASLAPWSMAFVASADLLRPNESLIDQSNIRVPGIAADVTSVAVDIMITTTICVQLRKNRTGFAKTNKMIDLLTLYTITSGLLPTIICIGSLISLSASKSTLADEVFNILVSKAFTNTLLAKLNARQSVRGRVDEMTIGGQVIDPMSFRISPTSTTNVVNSTDGAINFSVKEERSDLSYDLPR